MFTRTTFDFLAELTAHNERAWFEANKQRYETLVREPALKFIAAMRPHLARFAPSFRAEPLRVGGSLMRVHRDTRFSRDKTPYKTNVGIQFRHALGKDVHAPGFYVHLALDECFLAAGCWHPEPEALARIRAYVAARPARWFKARDDARFTAHWELAGDTLVRPPQGFAPDHPAIADLKRKDFVAVAGATRAQMLGPGLVKLARARFAEAMPLVKFLCDALEIGCARPARS
ncbi:MAG: DUF2461 domain-containing protein [Acidobacteria bacterium]|nr:DUF2461 domain-containing protein [Acidobacteriota bacterium]